MLRRSFERQDGQRGIDFADGPAEKIGGARFTASASEWNRTKNETLL
jgi:hypothetical protein